MRVFPIALIVIGLAGIAKYLGLIPVGTFHLVGPLVLIAIGVALLLRRPRPCREDWRGSHTGGAGASQPPSTGAV